MRIIVVCGAGASSTFVAQRMRRAIGAAGRRDVVTAVSITALPDRLDDADVLLVGPHLADRSDDLTRAAAGRGVRVIVLPGDIFGDRDGSRALALATGAAPTTPAPARVDERISHDG
ncbi:PTS sugar transporter [Microbacterium kribbense]